MSLKLARLTFLVRDYDEAIDWFGRALALRLIEDSDRGAGKRWVVMGPPDAGGGELLLAKAASPQQVERIGDQTGGRVFLFLETDDLDARRAHMEAEGVRFLEATRTEAYGKVAVFVDLYGNRWDLIEPAQQDD